MTQLIDNYGRVHNYVRISVTDRCNLRCMYCMPPEGMPFMPSENLMSFDEIAGTGHTISTYRRNRFFRINTSDK